MGKNPLQRPLKGVGPEIETFLGPEMATTNTHVHEITNLPVFYMGLGLNDFGGGKSIIRAIGRDGP
jgi:hypothetical protein